MDIKKNYDRVLLVVAGVITIACGGLLMMNSFSIGNKFDDVPIGRGKKMPDDNSEAVSTALTHVDKDVNWNYKTEERTDRVYRGFASIPIVKIFEKEGEFDLYDSTPEGRIRPPVTNAYLLQYRLPFERDDVLERDEDHDGFTNLEEFNGGNHTNPRDPKDYPDATNKLEIVKITATPYWLEMTSFISEDEFNVKKIDSADRKENWANYTKIGDTFPDDKGPIADRGRYKPVSAGVEDVLNERTKRKLTDVPFVMIEDSVVGDTFKLTKRVKLNRPIYSVSFRFNVPGPGVPATDFAKGDKFPLGKSGIEVEITEITADDVTIKYSAPGENPKTRKIAK